MIYITEKSIEQFIPSKFIRPRSNHPQPLFGKVSLIIYIMNRLLQAILPPPGCIQWTTIPKKRQSTLRAFLQYLEPHRHQGYSPVQNHALQHVCPAHLRFYRSPYPIPQSNASSRLVISSPGGANEKKELKVLQKWTRPMYYLR